MLINLDDAIAAIAAVQIKYDDGQPIPALGVQVDLYTALRALPVSDGVTDIEAKVQEIANTMCTPDWKYRQTAEHCARLGLQAALGPLPAPPTIE